MSSVFKKKPLSALLVDVYDVVVTAPLDSYKSFAANAYQCDEAMVEKAVANHWADMELGKLKPDEFWDRVGADLTEMGVQHSVPGWKFKGLWEGIVSDNLKLNQEMMATVRQARAVKTRTVAVANMNNEVATAFQKMGVFEPFNLAVLSCQVTARVPSPQMFSRTAKLARTGPAQCLYLSKNPQNLEGAKAAGFKTLAYDDNPQDTRWQLLQLGLLG